MKRRLVKLGQHTLMAAIPATWLKKQGLQKGDNVHFGEIDSLLILSSGPGVDRSREVLLDGDVWNSLKKLYTQGYDEIQLSYSKPLLPEIEAALHALHNVEITQTGKNYATIKATDDPSRKDFDSTLRRSFTLLKNIASTIQASLSNRERLHEVKTLEFTLNKYTLYLKRIINRSRFEYKHSMYVLIHNLELAANQLEYLRQYLEAHDVIIGKNVKQDFSQVQSILLSLPTLYYDFNEDYYHSLIEDKHTFDTITNFDLRLHLNLLYKHITEIANQIHELNV